MEIPAPEELGFDSYDAAKTYIYQHARENGYALSQGPKRLDKRTPPTIRRVDFRCDKGGKVRGHGVVRNSGSRMMECPFDLRLMRIDIVTGRWQVTVPDSKHNHPPSDDLRQHPLYRKLNDDEKQRVNQLNQAGVPPRMIVSALCTENPQTLIGMREVNNHKTKAQKERFNGLTPVELLIQELQIDNSWASHYTTDPEGHLNYLFFAYNPAIELAQRSPEILLMDATYRTNRYNLPLLHFMGVTCINTSFSSAWCFMAQETDELYHRSLLDFKDLVMGDAHIEVILTDDEKALKKAATLVFPTVPQLLCLWHVEKNVLTKIQKLWRVNGVDEQVAKVNEEKKKEFMGSWKQASSNNEVISALKLHNFTRLFYKVTNL
jgi:hypothetical protein